VIKTLAARIAASNYLFLAISIASLVGGLFAGSVGLGPVSIASYAVGAAVGFYLAVVWVIRAIRHGEFGSDVLAVISIAATALTSEWLAASVISVMLATGRALENWAEGRARMQLEALLARAPQVAHRIGGNLQIDDIPLSGVAIGDRLLVRSGEVVPIDGTLATEGTFDESALTGEPIPQWRGVGYEVSSGVLNSGSTVELTAIRISADSTYSNLIRLVQQAQASSANGVRLANKWAVRFVPFAIGLAILAWIISGQVENAVAVIVAATPCPLILAVPVAIISGMSKAASHGAIIKGGAALEQLAKAKTVLLDKTGTLTHGGPEISEIRVLDGVSEDRVLSAVASLEQASPHVVARAIVAEAQSRGLALTRPTEVREHHGHGLQGLVDGHLVSAGQPEVALPEWAQIESSLQIAVLVERKLVAVIGMDDPVRAESAETVSKLRELGINRVLLVSGDRKSTADQIGEAVGVDQVYAEYRPEQKLELVKSEMRVSRGAVVAVGDGINDAPALAAASAGVAMGARGATAASEAADVVIIEDSIAHLAVAIEIAQGARRRALQASGIGMGLAMVAMLAAAFGLFNATASAVSQELIDAVAILWALVPVALESKNRT
jgi:heavy metal translocating P-type ATPase